MLLYQYDGIFKDQKDVDANTLDYTGVGGAGKLFPGSMKFKDMNGDGKIDANDRVRSDKTNLPTFQGGLILGAQYKNFDISILFQAARGGRSSCKQNPAPLVTTCSTVLIIAGPWITQAQ